MTEINGWCLKYVLFLKRLFFIKMLQIRNMLIGSGCFWFYLFLVDAGGYFVPLGLVLVVVLDRFLFQKFVPVSVEGALRARVSSYPRFWIWGWLSCAARIQLWQYSRFLTELVVTNWPIFQIILLNSVVASSNRWLNWCLVLNVSFVITRSFLLLNINKRSFKSSLWSRRLKPTLNPFQHQWILINTTFLPWLKTTTFSCCLLFNNSCPRFPPFLGFTLLILFLLFLVSFLDIVPKFILTTKDMPLYKSIYNGFAHHILLSFDVVNSKLGWSVQ